MGRYGDVLDPILANRRDAFVNQAASTLRDIERRNADDRGASRFGADLYWLTEKLRFLFRACLLSELGFESGQISKFLNRDAYFQHISTLERGHEESKPAPKDVNISFQF